MEPSDGVVKIHWGGHDHETYLHFRADLGVQTNSA